MAYRSEIDGLRAVAVVPVLLFHAGFSLFSGGFVGVDVFFVISGFLITGIIVREAEARSFSYRRFYERRFRRLLPALYFMLACVVVAVWLLGIPPITEDVGEMVVATSLFGSNLLLSMTAGYFGPRAEDLPLLHTWSLAVEEQFYLAFPPFLAAARWLFPGRLQLLLWVAFLISLGTSVVAVQLEPTAAFYLLPFRAWELLAGSLLAVKALPQVPERHRSWIALAGLVGIGLSVVAYDASTSFPGFAALLPVLGTVAFIHAHTDGGTWVGDRISAEPFRTIGLISYSLYLWHWPVLILGRMLLMPPGEELGSAQALVALGFSTAVAYGSWRWVEAPFRQESFTAHRVFALSGVTIVAFVLLGAMLAVTDGGLRWQSEAVREIVAVSGDFDPKQRDCQKRPADRPCHLGDGARRVVLWGDSIAGALQPALDAATAHGMSIQVHTRSGCLPLNGVWRATPTGERCRVFTDAVLKGILEDPPDAVLLAGRWSLGETGSRPEDRADRIVLRSKGGVGANHELFRQGISGTLEALRGRGIPVIVVGPTPEFPFDVPLDVLYAHRMGSEPRGLSRETHLDRTRGVKIMFETLEIERYLDLDPLLCPAAYCVEAREGVPIYVDSNHFTETAAIELIGPALFELLDATLK